MPKEHTRTSSDTIIYHRIENMFYAINNTSFVCKFNNLTHLIHINVVCVINFWLSCVFFLVNRIKRTRRTRNIRSTTRRIIPKDIVNQNPS